MAKPATKRKRVPKEHFPCPNCVILVSQDYPSCQFKLVQSKIPGDTLDVLKEGIPIKWIKAAELTPARRLCTGQYHHSLIT